MDRRIYLDNSATTCPFMQVIDHMSQVSLNCYGNPSSLHSMGFEAEKLVTKARETISDCLGVMPAEIVFTSGGTESNNLAIRGFLAANPRKGRHIITTKIEHPSVLEVFKHLEELGYETSYLDVDQTGRADTELLAGMIRNDTALISIIMVNNETGSVQPIEEIAMIRDKCNRNTALHVDAIQAFGKYKIKPAKSGIDLMSFSSHKIHGPKGVGALYISKNSRVKPILFGGGQESQFRSGTENVQGISGFGLAAQLINEELEASFKKVSALNQMLREKLAGCDFEYAVLSPENASPYILSVSFPGLKGEVLLHHLEENGIFVSTGSACSSRKKLRSHVLTAMGLPGDVIDGAIRISFSAGNNESEIDTLVEALKEIVPAITVKQKKSLGGNK